MNIDDLELTIHDYCSEDDTKTVEGDWPAPVDLEKLGDSAQAVSDRVILMKRLGVLVAVMGSVTVHIHQKGRVSVNGVKSIDAARKIISALLP